RIVGEVLDRARLVADDPDPLDVAQPHLPIEIVSLVLDDGGLRDVSEILLQRAASRRHVVADKPCLRARGDRQRNCHPSASAPAVIEADQDITEAHIPLLLAGAISALLIDQPSGNASRLSAGARLSRRRDGPAPRSATVCRRLCGRSGPTRLTM